LRPFQVEGRGLVAVGGDPLDILPPEFPRVAAQLGGPGAEQHVPGAFDVGRGEGFAVMPADPALQLEGERLRVLAPRPARGEVGHDRRQAVLRDVLVIDGEVVEHPHHRHRRREARLLDHRHAARTVAVIDFEDAPGLLRGGRAGHDGNGEAE
jgi:hypothetical protein